MLEAKLVIEIPGLATAVEALAAAIAHRAQTVGATADVLAQRRTEYGVFTAPTSGLTPAPVTPPPDPAPVTPPTAPASVTPPGPTQAPSYNPGPAPTTPPPSYSHEQVGKAGADLIATNQAKIPDLLALLQQFGVPAITQLRPDQLGPFATALRGLGAKI